MQLWKEKVKGKPYVPTSLTDIPENISKVDLAIRVESVLNEYYAQEKVSASQYDSAYNKHFSEISQHVDAGTDHGLFRNSNVEEESKQEEVPHSQEPEIQPEEPVQEPEVEVQEPEDHSEEPELQPEQPVDGLGEN